MDRPSLIAVDLDCTLLTDAKTVPDGFFPLLDRILASGTVFVVASGRQYRSASVFFKGYEDRIRFITDNGSVTFRNGAPASCFPMDGGAVDGILETMRSIPYAYPILCCTRGGYLGRLPGDVFDFTSQFFPSRVVADDPLAAARADDTVCKIAIYHDPKFGAEEEILPALGKFAGKVNFFESDSYWVDIVPKGVTKGSSLKRLMDELGISPGDCMSFGDYDNDVAMLELCGRSYAMANGTPAAKAAAKSICPSNNEGGVVRILEKIWIK